MATKKSATVMVPGEGLTGVGAADGMIETRFYVRTMARAGSLFDRGATDADAYEAVSESYVRSVVGGRSEYLSKIKLCSDAPRPTEEAAVRDMHHSIWLAMERGAKVTRGDVPAAPYPFSSPEWRGDVAPPPVAPVERDARVRAIERLTELLPLAQRYAAVLTEESNGYVIDDVAAIWEAESWIPRGFAALEVKAVLEHFRSKGVEEENLVSIADAAARLADSTKMVGPGFLNRMIRLLTNPAAACPALVW